jgi:hypothetical protein
MRARTRPRSAAGGSRRRQPTARVAAPRAPAARQAASDGVGHLEGAAVQPSFLARAGDLGGTERARHAPGVPALVGAP